MRVDDELLAICNRAYDDVAVGGSASVDIGHVVVGLARFGAAGADLLRHNGLHVDEVLATTDRWLSGRSVLRRGDGLPRTSPELKTLLQRSQAVAASSGRSYAGLSDFLTALLEWSADLDASGFVAELRMLRDRRRTRWGAPRPGARRDPDAADRMDSSERWHARAVVGHSGEARRGGWRVQAGRVCRGNDRSGGDGRAVPVEARQYQRSDELAMAARLLALENELAAFTARGTRRAAIARVSSRGRAGSQAPHEEHPRSKSRAVVADDSEKGRSESSKAARVRNRAGGKGRVYSAEAFRLALRRRKLGGKRVLVRAHPLIGERERAHQGGRAAQSVRSSQRRERGQSRQTDLRFSAAPPVPIGIPQDEGLNEATDVVLTGLEADGLDGAEGGETGAKRFYLALDDEIVRAPSIGPRTAERLNGADLFTVRDLFSCDAVQVMRRTGTRFITAQRIADWQAQARLVCIIPWLRGSHAQLLVGAGYRTLEDLNSADASQVALDILEFAVTREGQSVLRAGPPPDEDRVGKWLAHAALAEPSRAG